MAALGLATEDDDGATASSRTEMPKKAPPKPVTARPTPQAVFRTADNADGLAPEEKSVLLGEVAELRKVNMRLYDEGRVGIDLTKQALDEANVELPSQLSDDDLVKLRDGLRDISAVE